MAVSSILLTSCCLGVEELKVLVSDPKVISLSVWPSICREIIQGGQSSFAFFYVTTLIVKQARNQGKISNGIRGNCKLFKTILRQAGQ